ncbi:hypothetical protein LTR97_011348 [Elasticomyces elasticus]|uniref:Uncharacterized protein n=1 Tax=Elasticomyces elasticus TaxID=574655 RepID=A0AAN7ZR71_9PEZI|nr:hypothetical protein LTR97_011348 [Elasticomyces elasticus]
MRNDTKLLHKALLPQHDEDADKTWFNRALWKLSRFRPVLCFFNARICTLFHQAIVRPFLNWGLENIGLDTASITELYSIRKLSVANDRLPAFQALATILAEGASQHFTAGIWSQRSARSMFWYAVSKEASSHFLQRAPSWSWVSWDGRIKGFTPEASIDHVRRIDLWTQGYGHGLSKGLEFLEGNPFMSCVAYDQTWNQLDEVIGLWLPGYPAWSQDLSFLLYVDASCQSGKTGSSKPHYCPHCHQASISGSEDVLLQHAEYCPESPFVVQIENDGPIKLVGVARFDRNDEPPPNDFKSVILWDCYDPTTFHVESVRKSQQSIMGTLSAKYADLPGFANDIHPVRSSADTIFGMESAPELRQQYLHRHWHIALGPHPSCGKHLYFLLLIGPAGDVGSYRRVGIGIAFWLPKVERLGGLRLPQIAKRERVVLV